MAPDETDEKLGNAKSGIERKAALALTIAVVISALAALAVLLFQRQPRARLMEARAARVDGRLVALPWGGSYHYWGDSVVFDGAYKGMETNEDRLLPRPPTLIPVNHQP